MIRAVIFDLDDTLLKTHAVKWEQHKAVARDFYDHELSNETLRKHWGKPFDELIATLHINADTVENMRKVYAATDAQFLKQIQHDSLRVVQALREKGIEVGVVTATNKAFTLLDLGRSGFPLEQFFCIQGADETPFHKPDPRVFDPVFARLQQLNIKKEEMVYVGDALTDLQAARDAKIRFVAVTTGLHSAEEFKKEGARHIIDRLSQLSHVLETMESIENNS